MYFINEGWYDIERIHLYLVLNRDMVLAVKRKKTIDRISKQEVSCLYVIIV